MSRPILELAGVTNVGLEEVVSGRRVDLRIKSPNGDRALIVQIDPVVSEEARAKQFLAEIAKDFDLSADLSDVFFQTVGRVRLAAMSVQRGQRAGVPHYSYEACADHDIIIKR